jgi:hypothetical protein
MYAVEELAKLRALPNFGNAGSLSSSLFRPLIYCDTVIGFSMTQRAQWFCKTVLVMNIVSSQ